jgi:hypothetical protein
MYNGALADLNLGSNPWNMSRYTYAGGNPTTLVEYDGHLAIRNIDSGAGGGGGDQPERPPEDDDLEWINNSTMWVGEQLIIAPRPDALATALEGAQEAYCGERPDWMCGEDSWLTDPDHYEASIQNEICVPHPEWCGWDETMYAPAAEEMGLPVGSVAKGLLKGAAKGVKGLIKDAHLPSKGGFRYVPGKVQGGKLPTVRWHDGRTGYLDRFGNVWIHGPSRTQGQPFEWDVQLRNAISWRMRDGSVRTTRHMNISLDGRITHITGGR